MESDLKLPEAEKASVPRRKIVDYLLSSAHPVGSAKARFFYSRGFTASEPERFEEALLEVAKKGEVISTEDSEWGTKYFVVGTISAPDGSSVRLGTVWIVPTDEEPTLITAYPARE